MKNQGKAYPDCLFCQKYGRKPIDQIDFAPLLNRALYTKYSKQKWHGRRFEDFFSNKPVKWVIDFKDRICLEDKDEFLKRFYPSGDQQGKFDQLLEYYKYHKDIPRMFILNVSDVAIYFYEKKKQYEYKKIKLMLGIPVDPSSDCTQQEKLQQEIQVLDDMTRQTQVSSQSLLKELLKQNEDNMNIDATWISMTQGKQPNNLAPNLKLLKQLISKNNKLKESTRLKMPFSVYSYNQQLKKNSSPCLQINLQQLAKDSSQKSIKTIKNSNNPSDNQSDYQRFLKQQIITLNHYSSGKNSLKGTQPQHQSKQNSIHHITSTRSISQEQLRMSYAKKPNHKKSQTHYTDIGSPMRKESQISQGNKLQKMYTNMGSEGKSKSQDKLFKIYTSQSNQGPMQTNINININQLNMNNLNIKSPFQQYKALVESPKVNSSNLKKKCVTLRNSESQRVLTSSQVNSQKKQISTLIIEKIRNQKRNNIRK